MALDELTEFLRGMPSYAATGEAITAELVFLTDDEVDALPDV
jgi:hypothetical protein